MSRILCFCLLALSFWTIAKADNILQVSSSQGHPGDEISIAVSLEGDSMPTAVELQFDLNDALKYVEHSALLCDERSKDHNLSAAVKNGRLSIVIFSATLSQLQGTSGELCNFKLKLGKEPGNYLLTPTVLLSDAQGRSIKAIVKSGSATLLSPKIEVVTPTIDFGHIPIRSVYSKNLALRNVGNEPLIISAITSNRSELMATQQSYSIAPGQTQQVALTFSPIIHGSMESSLNITSNAINPRASIAKVMADPYSVNELHVQKATGNADEEVTVVLKMNNMEPIAAAQCSFTLPKELEYVENSATIGNRCANTDHKASGFVQGQRLTLLLYSSSNTTLPEGDGELLTFRLKLKGYSGNYTLKPEDVVLSNAAVENIVSATTGNNVVIKSPKLSAGTALNLSNIPVAQESTGTFTLRNYGNQNLVINKITFLNEGYSIAEELPITILSYKTANITIKTTPQREGNFSTIMQVYSNDPLNRMHTINISGTAFENNQWHINGRNTESGYQFKFGLDNYSEVVALQMNLKWNVDMTTATNMLKPSERLKHHSTLITDMGEGTYQLLIYSMSNETIEGHSGELFTLDYQASPNASYRNTTLSIENIVLSNALGENKSNHPLQTATAKFTHFWLRHVVDGKMVSEQLVETNQPLEHPIVEDSVGHTLIWEDMPTVMPAEDLMIQGRYEVNTYTLYYYLNEELVHTETKDFGENIETYEPVVEEGWTFEGWNIEVPTTMPAHDVYIYGLLSEKPDDVAGDVNNDGLVNVFDIVAVINRSLSSDVDNLGSYDVNKDGLINIFDIVQIINLSFE